MVITYLANVRLPTEKAHGLQIVEQCEALGAAGADVTLVVPRRWNRAIRPGIDVWQHYGVDRTFNVRRVPCLDLFPLGRWFEPVAARLQVLSYTLAALAMWGRRRTDAIYSRDSVPFVVLGLIAGARHLVYEAHQLPDGRVSAWLQRAALRRATLVVAVTSHLAEALRSQGARQVMILGDGFRSDRFASMPDATEARREAGVAETAFMVGYVGQLRTMEMPKGLDVVVDAIALLRDSRVHLCVVGGPPDAVAALKARWTRLGRPESTLHTPGDVPPARVPDYLAAFDAAVVPLPWTPHFAYCASPLKLFEYMAAGRAIIASDLPSIREVVQEGVTALVVPPSDADAFAAALVRLRDDADLRLRLGSAARAASTTFTWDVRARRVLAALGA